MNTPQRFVHTILYYARFYHLRGCRCFYPYRKCCGWQHRVVCFPASTSGFDLLNIASKYLEGDRHRFRLFTAAVPNTVLQILVLWLLHG